MLTSVKISSNECFSGKAPPLVAGFRIGIALLAAVLLQISAPTGSFAVSLEDIQVKSNFGEQFHAEIELTGIRENDVEVVIGNAADYEKMKLGRPGIIDKLRIKPPLGESGGKKFAQVVSDEPLFYPSFNLLVGVKIGSGVIFENYLITVDFKDSVSFKGIRSNTGQASMPPPSPAETRPGKGIERESEENSGSIVARQAVPLENRELPSPPKTKIFPIPEPKIEAPDKEDAPFFSPRSKKKVQSRQAKRDPFNLAPDASQSVPPVSPAKSGKFGPLDSGATLQKIAEALNIDPAEFDRFAVALWMDNKDKFIDGNINGLKSGVELEIGNLENRMATLDNSQARQVIQSQWGEWKSQQPTASTAEPDTSDQVPMELSQSLKEKIMALVAEWKESWEKEDLARHMALFYKGPEDFAAGGESSRYEYWHRFKKMMFARHDDVKINFENLELVSRGRKLISRFDQGFDSNRMKSFGRKTIEFIQVGSDWKITNEKFAVEEFLDKEKDPSSASASRIPVAKKPMKVMEGKFPIVILAATQMDVSSAVRVANELKQIGFNAYFSPAYITDTKKIYRVFVGRFSDSRTAEELTKSLKKFEISGNAAVMRFPYVLEAGKHLKREDAEKQIMELQAKGISGFMFSENKKSDASVSVYVGAFQAVENAEKMAGDVAGAGLSVKVKAP